MISVWPTSKARNQSEPKTGLTIRPLIFFLLFLILFSSCRRRIPNSDDADDTDASSPDAPETITTIPNPTPPVCLRAPGSFSELVSRLSPNLVTLFDPSSRTPLPQGPESALPLSLSNDPQPHTNSLGSAFVLGPEGRELITTSKIVQNRTNFKALLHDGRQVDVTLRGVDESVDLAVLTLSEPISDALHVADCPDLRPGQWVAVLSSPFGTGPTITTGVIRYLTSRPGLAPPPFVRRYIGVDAVIDTANWGGLVIDTSGNLVGMSISAPRAGSHIGLVLPANHLRRSVTQLSNHGRPARTWLGLWVRAVKTSQYEGLEVTRIFEDGPAQEGGLQPNDVILEFFGQPVSETSELISRSSEVPPNIPVPVVILRQGQRRTLRIRPAPRPQ